MPSRERPQVRLLFDELLPPGVARALRELGFRTSHVGHVEDRQPPRGSDDAAVLDHAVRTNQVVVTYNHDMIMLCAERAQPVIWIDPRGRQFRHDELAVVAFAGIGEWQRLLAAQPAPVCIRVMRTKVEVVPLDRAHALASRRMRVLTARSHRRARSRAEVAGQLTAD